MTKSQRKGKTSKEEQKEEQIGVMWSQAEGGWKRLKAVGGKEPISPGAAGGNQRCQHLSFSPVSLTLDISSAELATFQALDSHTGPGTTVLTVLDKVGRRYLNQPKAQRAEKRLGFEAKC